MQVLPGSSWRAHMSRRKGERPRRPYYRFPWTPSAADEALRQYREGLNFRAISAHLGEVFSRPDGEPWPPGPATIRRLCLKHRAVRS